MLTSLGAILGTLVGGHIGELYLQECLAFTTGGFLYFAINGLMHELKEMKSFIGLIFCMGSMFLGIYFMYLFALLE